MSEENNDNGNTNTSNTNTTVARVKLVAKHLENIATAKLQLFIDDAMLEVAGDLTTSDLSKMQPGDLERLQRYLAAHLATLDTARPTDEGVGNRDMTRSFNRAGGSGQEQLDATEYGQEYNRLLKRIRGGGFSFRMM